MHRIFLARDRVIARVSVALRQRAALFLHRLHGLSLRPSWSVRLLRDFARNHPGEYRRFLWTHGLHRSESARLAAGFDRAIATRELLLGQLQALIDSGIAIPGHEIGSVLDAGCAAGFMLHACERRLFPRARRLLGIDADGAAIAAGSAWLRRRHSRIRLLHGDLRQLDALVADELFDVVFCAGVLADLPPAQAAAIVVDLLRHTRHLLVLSGPASPSVVTPSGRRPGLTHAADLRRLVEQAGGCSVIPARGGATPLAPQAFEFVFAVPAAAALAVAC